MSVCDNPQLVKELRALERELNKRQGDDHTDQANAAYNYLYHVRADEIRQLHGLAPGTHTKDGVFLPATGGIYRSIHD